MIIPARLASTRLPRKLLLKETGKSVLQHTYEAAQAAQRPRGICVAADHPELVEEVRAFSGQVFMTRADHQSGTDRVAEVARRLRDVDIVVNLQGDEPELPAAAIDRVVELLEGDPGAVMATLATPVRAVGQLHDPACVKVVFDHSGRALYFSRAPIPYAREGHSGLLEADLSTYFQHIGLYAYRRNFLLELTRLPPSPLEKVEKLEQLRVLEAGYHIQVGVIEDAAHGIDTAEDYRAFVERVRSR